MITLLSPQDHDYKRNGTTTLFAALNVAAHNREPQPFVWKADPKAIIAAAKRGYQR